MRYYADTSWWLGCKCKRDRQHPKAVLLFDRDSEANILWTPWQRVEVFNSFRQAERHGLLASGEARRIIKLLEHEVTIGYWQHVEFNWTSAVREAGRLSAAHSLSQVIRGMDLFHVAIACELEVEAFLTFDQDQADLAKAAGLEVPDFSVKGP